MTRLHHAGQPPQPTTSSRRRLRGPWMDDSVRPTTPNWAYPAGHIGMFVSRKSQGIVGKGMVDWLVERDS